MSRTTVYLFLLCAVVCGGCGGPLHKAAAKNDLARAKILVDKGADLNQRELWYYHTPLQKAISAGNAEMVKLLIDAGAEVNTAGYGNLSALYRAIGLGHEDMVKLLIDAGADVNTTVYGNFSPLHKASAAGYIEIVRMLIKAGADVNVQSHEDHWSALNLAIANKHSDIAAYLIENGASLNQKGTKYDRTPLHLTAEFDLFNIAELLIEKGADIEAREGSVGAPPLFEAAQRGRLEIVKLLIENGANPNNATRAGFKPIQIAKQNKHYDIVRYIESLSEDRSKIQERNIASAKVRNKVDVDSSVSHSNKNVDEKNYAQRQEDFPESNNKRLGQLILKMLPEVYMNNWEMETRQPSDYSESLEEFCKLLKEGADPQAIRIDGFKSSSETVNLNSNVQLTRFSSGSQGKIVAADKEGLTLLEFCKKNDLKEVYEILEHHLAVTNNRIEELMWQKKQTEDSISGYEEYLKKYPEGKFAPEANQRLHDLYWERTFANVNRASFELYLKKFPEGKYSKNAEYRIERFIWAEAEDKKTDVDLYRNYLDRYPAGQYADKAKERIEELL